MVSIPSWRRPIFGLARFSGFDCRGHGPFIRVILKMAMISKTFMIQNKFGLHARPSASFVQTASRYRSEIQVEKDGQVADGKSILDLMTLAAAYGTFITVKAKGDDAEDVLTALETLIDGRFGED
jgi:phosphocarrier protein HPr